MHRAAVVSATVSFAASAAVFAALSFASVALASAARAETPLDGSVQTRPLRLVVLGSSTAAAAGANPASMGWVNRYTVYVKTLNPANEVANRAVGGYTTYHLMPTGFVPPAGRPAPDTERNITWALAHKPDAILINLPSNDAAAGVPVEEQQRNYRTIADLARAAGVPLWVSTTQPRNLDDKGRASQIAMRDWTRTTFGARAMDFWTGLAEPDGRLSPRYDSGDGIHLNNVGHALLFQRAAAENIPFILSWQPANR